jgi:hypothetical protein
MKAVSVIVSSVLLIAIVVAVASILNLWIISFSKTQTSQIGEKAETSISCSYGGINLRSLSYSSSNQILSGQIINTGNILLGNLTMYIIYDNATTQQFPLCRIGGSVQNCTNANLSLKKGEIVSFSLQIGSNYESVRISTNCTTVYDEATKSEIS